MRHPFLGRIFFISALLPMVSIAQMPPSSPVVPSLPPAIALPTIKTTAQPMSVKPAAMTPETMIAAPLTEVQKFSFGDAPDSLMFSREQIEAMKTALRTYEDSKTRVPDGTPVVVQAPAPEAIAEPATYPVFYLTSIVYHHANDWTIWIANGEAASVAASASAVPATKDVPAANQRLMRITPKSNVGELTAVNVSADRIEFLWKPSYMPAMKARVAKKLFAPVASVKHRIAQSAIVVYDDKAEAIRFVLKQNQAFAAAYFNCFEGQVASVALESLTPTKSNVSVAAPVSLVNGAAGGGAATSSARDDIDSILAAEQAKAANTAASAGNH